MKTFIECETPQPDEKIEDEEPTLSESTVGHEDKPLYPESDNLSNWSFIILFIIF